MSIHFLLTVCCANSEEILTDPDPDIHEWLSKLFLRTITILMGIDVGVSTHIGQCDCSLKLISLRPYTYNFVN